MYNVYTLLPKHFNILTDDSHTSRDLLIFLQTLSHFSTVQLAIRLGREQWNNRFKRKASCYYFGLDKSTKIFKRIDP